MRKAICPECNKPCGPHRPGATVYHMACLEAKYKVLRKQWAKEKEDERRQW